MKCLVNISNVPFITQLTILLIEAVVYFQALCAAPCLHVQALFAAVCRLKRHGRVIYVLQQLAYTVFIALYVSNKRLLCVSSTDSISRRLLVLQLFKPANTLTTLRARTSISWRFHVYGFVRLELLCLKRTFVLILRLFPK